MPFVVRGLGWGRPRDNDFYEDFSLPQQWLKCYVMRSIPNSTASREQWWGLAQRRQDAAVFATRAEAEACLWDQEAWWETQEDGSPDYWIEETA